MSEIIKPIELKPCPFCGSEDVRFMNHTYRCNRKNKDTGEWEPDVGTSWSADCFQCGCCTDFFNTPAKAAKAWNRRMGGTT